MKHNQIIFQIGSRVQVLKDYQQDSSPWRTLTGIVREHRVNDSMGDHMDAFIDNYIEFETGQIEPFANWELENETK